MKGYAVSAGVTAKKADPEPKKNSHSRKKVDLTGKRFGQLVVLGPAENIGNKTAWLCRCDCGREVVKRTSNLQSGRVKSCQAVPICERLTMIDGTCVEILRSKTIRKNNTSGVTGVEWVQSAHRWRATISFKGKRRYLGKFEKFEDAVKARKEAEENLHDLFVEEFDKGEHERR